jgi:Regulator of chromosome condensation (RCC1) repeat
MRSAVLALMAAACASEPRARSYAGPPYSAPGALPPPRLPPCGAAGGGEPPAPVEELALGRATSCARLGDGSVWCWGARNHTMVDADVVGARSCSVATRVADLGPSADLLPWGEYTCSARADGAVACLDFQQRVPDFTMPDARAKRLWSSAEAMCGVTANGQLRCARPDGKPVVAPALAENAVVALDDRLCAVAKGRVVCKRADGAVVALGQDVVQIASGDALWVLAKGGVLTRWSRGRNGGEPELDYLDPPADVAEVVASGPRACVRAGAPVGKVICWTADNFTNQIAGVSDAVRIAVADTHACAVRATGQVVCWGSNVCGESGGDVERGVCTGSPSIAVTAIRWAR